MHLRLSLGKELLSGGLLLCVPVLDGLLDLGHLVDNGCIRGRQLQSLVKVPESFLLFSQAGVRNGATVESLGLVCVFGTGRFRNIQRVARPGLTVPELTQLVGKQGGVGVQCEAQSLDLAVQFLGVILTRFGELMQVAQRLLVLFQTNGMVPPP